MKKVALVTGASSGIGKSAAIELYNNGFEVYATARRIDKMHDLNVLGINVLSMDVTNHQSVKDAIGVIISKNDRIDILVNSAGYGLMGTIEETELEQAQQQFDVNLFGLSRITRMVIPIMRKNNNGKIINISSIGGIIYTPYAAYYHATKHALEAYSDCLRYELKQFNIKVVVIQPGIIKSEWSSIAKDSLLKNSSEGYYSDEIKEYANYMAKIYDTKKATKPDVIGKLISKVALKKKPKPRYFAGHLSRISILGRKLLNDSMYDRILRKQIQFISKN